MFEDIVEKRILHWVKQDNSILVDRSILKELNELREYKKDIAEEGVKAIFKTFTAIIKRHKIKHGVAEVI